MTKSEFFELADKAGFAPDDDCGLSGQSDDDVRAYVGEYPCGEYLLKLAALLNIDLVEGA